MTDPIEFLPRYLPGRKPNPAWDARYRKNNRKKLAAHAHAYYQGHKEEHRADNRRRYQILKAWREGYKLMVGCVDCGYREHPEALDYDHRPGEDKSFSVGKWRGRPLRLWEEIQKCDVRCANCHRVVTSRRRDA